MAIATPSVALALAVPMLSPWRYLLRRSLRLWRAALAPAIPRIGFRGHFLESLKPFVGKMLVTCWSDQQRRPEQRSGLGFLAPRVGFEPTTLRLTAGCSAVELPRNACAFPSAQGSIIANCTTGASGLFLKMSAFLISSIIAGVLPLVDPQPTRISAGLDIPHARQQGGRALRALV